MPSRASHPASSASAVPATVDAYIAAFPPAVRSILEQVRAAIRAAAPTATETISYRMPAYRLGGVVVYFGGFTEHVGLYPPVRDAALQREAEAYANDRGNLRFRYDAPIPFELISRIVQARVRENQERVSAKRRSR